MDFGINLGGALATATSLIGQRKREQRAMANQQKLMGVQLGHQQQLNTEAYERQRLLNEQAQSLQMKTWEQTNYPAQMKMLREAGLNPALLYGLGGAGGSTTGSGTGGNAPSGNAAGGNAPAPQPMDLQNMLLGSQIKLINAQRTETLAKADQAKAEADATRGYRKDEATSRISVNEGIITLNLSQEQLNDASTKLKQSERQTQATVRNLNIALTKLNDQKTQESIAKMNIDNETYNWMKRTGLNPADSQLAKMIQYLSDQTGFNEESIIYVIGGAIGFRELIRLIPKQLLDRLGKGYTPIKGFK